jgi:hypothetical protein
MLTVFGGSRLIPATILGSLFLSLAPVSCAQFEQLDALGKHLAKELERLKPKMVAVADLSESQGDIPGQGHYFSDFVSNSIQHYAKKLPVLRHWDFDSDLQRDGVPPNSFVSAEAVANWRAKIPEDILVIGTISRDAQAYALSVSAIRATGGQILFSERTTFPRTEFLDSWSEPFPPALDATIFRYPDSEIGNPPSCIHCPVPKYSVYARRDKLQANPSFNALISPDGRVVRLQPTRTTEDGLDAEAFTTIKTWRFKPATNKKGLPVYIIIPIEVTFRLF